MLRGVRNLARCVAAVGLVIGVAACGGGSGDDSAATTIATTATDAALPAPDETVTVAEVSATVRAIVDRLGPDAAFAAVVLALDAGYGVEQIAQHAAVLTSDGTIPGAAPLGPPSGVFATATAQGLRLAAEKTPAQALANLKAKAYDEDTVETLLGTVLLLAGTGYSAEQILEGLLFGEQRYARTALDPDPDGGGARYERCILLAEQDGTLITPAGPSTVYGKAQNCAIGIRNPTEILVVIDDKWIKAGTTPSDDNAATEPAASTDPATAIDAYPRVFRGDGLHRITFYDSDSDRTKICENDVEIELRLEADGRALFTYSPGMGMYRDGEEFECREAAGNAWTGTYDAAAGTFTIAPPAEDPEREYWDVGGDFDESSAFGPAGYSRLHPYADESGFQRNTYDFEFSMLRVP